MINKLWQDVDCKMPLVLPHMPMSEVLIYGKMCTLESMKDYVPKYHCFLPVSYTFTPFPPPVIVQNGLSVPDQ